MRSFSEEEKFIDMQLPGSGMREDPVHPKGRFASVRRGLVDEKDPELQRFLQQAVMQDSTGKPISATAITEIYSFDEAGLRAQIPSIGNLDYLAADKVAKNARAFARDMTKPQDERDEFERIGILARIRFFSEYPADLIFADTLNQLYDDGVTKRFPEETARLLEVGMKMPCGPDKIHRFEFFDAYYRHQVTRGKLDEVIAFVRSNYPVVSNMGLIFSKSFNDLFRRMPVGDSIRCERMKYACEVYMAKLAKHSAGRKGDEAIVGLADRFVSNYIGQYLIGQKGAYDEARRVFEAYQKIAPAGSTDTSMWAETKDALHSLASSRGLAINNNHTRDYGHATTPSIARERAITREKSKVTLIDPRWSAARARGDDDTCIEILQDMYNDDAILYETHFNFIAEFLQICIQRGETEPEKMSSGLEKIFEAARKGMLRIPLELHSTAVAQLAQTYYDGGEDQKVIALCLREYPDDKKPVVRGTSYYFLKACFREGMGKVGARFIAGQLHKFADTEWEEELWRDYIMLRYAECEEELHDEGDLRRGVVVMDKIVASDKSNVRAQMVRARLAIKSKAHVAKLPLYCREMNTAAYGDEETAPEEPLATHVQRTNRDAAQKMLEAGRIIEVRELIRTVPGYEKDRTLVEKLCRSLLNPEGLTHACFDEAEKLLELHPDLADALGTNVTRARERLMIVAHHEVGGNEYFDGLLGDKKRMGELTQNDGVRMAFLFRELREVISFYRAYILALNEGDLGKEAQGDYPIDGGALSEIFGLEEMNCYVYPPEKEGMRMRCVQVASTEKPLELNVMEFVFNKKFELVMPDFDCTPENEALKKLLFRLLECALMEKVVDKLQANPAGLLRNAMIGHSKELEAFRKSVQDALLTEKNGARRTPEGMEGMEAENRLIIERLAKSLDAMRRDPNFPAPEELQGFIARYIELITHFRDLEAPIVDYKSSVNPQNPFSKHLKYLRIMSPRAAGAEFERRKIPEKAYGQFEIDSPARNNFSGYYQLASHFPDAGREMNLSIFLDKKGHAHIPGVEKDNPLYPHIWMLTLESLAKKVVPALGPYAQAFLNKPPPPHTDSTSRRFGLPTGGNTTPRVNEHRVWCSALVLQHLQGAGKGRASSTRLAALDDVTEALNTMALSEKDITEWPLYYRDDKQYRRADGLVVSHEGKNYLDVDILKWILGKDFIRVETLEVGGKMVCDITALPQEMRAKVMSAIRVQTLPGRAYRLPVSFGEPEYEIEIIDGVDCYLVPAKRKTRRTVERGGSLFIAKPVPPHTKVNVGTRLYHATPWQMSDDQGEVYKKTSTIEVDFSMQRVVYAVLYDPQDSKILGYMYVGPATKDGNDDYTNSVVRNYRAAHDQGALVTLNDAKMRGKFAGRSGLKEALFEVETSVGYKQGVFPEIWKFLTTQGGARNAILRLLMTTMEQKLGSEAYAKLVASLAKMNEAAPVTSPKNAPRAPRAAIDAKKTTPDAYEISPRLFEAGDHNMKHYMNLRDRKLFPVSETDPRYAEYAEVFGLEPGDMIVLIDSPDGKPVRVKQSMLRKL